jgi:hypothetical protein
MVLVLWFKELAVVEPDGRYGAEVLWVFGQFVVSFRSFCFF